MDRDNLALIPPLLHQTLSTISSTVFSKLVLKLQSLPGGYYSFHELAVEAIWGDDWGMVDRDLDDMVKATGNGIKFVVQVLANGEVPGVEFRRFVGHLFPLMHARRLVSVLSLS